MKDNHNNTRRLSHDREWPSGDEFDVIALGLASLEEHEIEDLFSRRDSTNSEVCEVLDDKNN